MTRLTTPSVSVILPAFNRARLLPEAFASIRAQTFTDFEVIVVDDGSSDNSRQVVEDLSRTLVQPVRYSYQPNQGPAAARNHGVDQSQAPYVAFFDSDDLWLPHHLHDCVRALDANQGVDWIYGACQVVDLTSGAELQESSFHPQGRNHPFLALKARPVGRLRIISDTGATECMIAHGLMCGLQGSVLRRRVFDAVRLPLRRIGEDQIFAIQVLKSGFTLAYFDDVHAVYRVHDDGCSARQTGALDRAVAGIRELVTAYEALPAEVTLTPSERRALKRRIGEECFWTLGYSLFWQHGQRAEALKAYRKALRYLPWDYRLWKTYAAALARKPASPGLEPL